MNIGRTGKTVVPGAASGVGGLDQMLDAVVVGAPDPAASHAFLLVLSGTDPGRLHVLDRPEMVIGRSRYADIHISERALSQQHCKLTRHGDHHRLFDLGSTNGTFVNDMRVQQADLKPGDVIRTGETVFTYMSGSQAAAGPVAGPMAQAPGMPVPQPHPMAGAPSPSTALMRRPQPAPHPGPSTALARRAPQPLITVAEGGYAGAPQMLDIPAPAVPAPAAAEAPDLLARILWAIGFLRRYWLSILLCTMLGAGLGLGSYKFIKPPAKAEFEISLVPEASDNPAERMRRTNFEFFRSAQNNFKRPGLIHETLKQLGETNVSPDLIRAKQAALEFNKVGEYTYRGAFAAATADDAIKFLDVHLELYRESEIDKALKVLIAEVDTLGAQLAQSAEKLNSTNQSILAFKQEHSEGLPEKSSFLLSRVLELSVERSRAVGELTRTSANAQVARKSLKSEDPEIESRVEESRPYAANIADVNRRLAAARAEGKGDDHPDIKKLEDEKAALERIRDEILLHGGGSKVIKTKNPAYKSARVSVTEAEAAQRVAAAELSRVTKELEEMEGMVDKLPRLQAEYNQLTRDQLAVQKTYDDLFQQLNGTRIRLELERSQAAARYDVITPPNVIPVSRLKTLIIRGGIGTFMGMFIGLALGLLREGRRYLAARLAAARR
ncbi:MAG: FHA domain-containing protein [Myxococcota bacterium]